MIDIFTHEFFSFLLFVLLAIFLLAGYPVSLTLAGTAIIVALLGYAADLFPVVLLNVLPNRVFGLVTNETLIAVPLFIFMGVMLEKSGVAVALLENMSKIWGKIRGGLVYSVLIVGRIDGSINRDRWSNSGYNGYFKFTFNVKMELQ